MSDRIHIRLGALLLLGVVATGCVSDPGVVPYDRSDGRLGSPVVYEAEASSSQRGCTIETRHAGYTGAGYVDFGDRGTYVEWSDVVAPAGEHTLTLRYANGGTSSRPVSVRVNGRDIGRVELASTGAWTRWSTARITVTLARGPNVVRVTAVGAGPNVDHLIGPDRDLGPTEAVYQAEDRTAQLDCTEQATHAGFDGRGYMDFGGQGAWIEWRTVTARVTADHTFTFRYANGGSAPRPAQILVNGTVAGAVEFAPTGGWSSWRTVSTTVPLAGGDRRIRIVATSSAGGPNIDRLAVLEQSTAGGDAGGPMPPFADAGVGTDASTAPSPTEPSPIRLPIEVMGPSGTSVTVRFRLPERVSDITHLLVTCHACGYNDHALDSDPSRVKAAFQVNGGSRVALKYYTHSDRGGVVGTTSIRLLDPTDEDYGGIGGAFHTNRIMVPVSGLRPGINEITFTHVNAGTSSTGFRIVSMNLTRGTSPSATVLASSQLVDDDPRRWSVAGAIGSSDPTVQAAAIRAGRDLWYRTDHLYDPAIDALDGRRGGTAPLDGRIHASCSGCHAQDGRDLAYFNYSNHSIVERAYFHGIPREDGRRIAAYIRSLDVPVVPQARPWNPPYQPGPGMDSRPVHEWAAGAGLGAVLAEDSDMAPYLFPGGTSATAVRRVVDRFGTLNMRELPVAMQLPDWNRWLPPVHPSDAFDVTAAAIRQDERGNGVGAPFFDFLYERAVRDPSPTNLGELVQRMEKWITRGGTCYTQSVTTGPGWRATNSLVMQAVQLGDGVAPGIGSTECSRVRHDPVLNRPGELAKHGLIAWASVKLWEIHHTRGLETRGAGMTAPVCIGSRCVDASEARGWVTTDRHDVGTNVFNRAPHYVSFDSRHFTHQSEGVGRYDSSVWYHLQMILNSGYRRTAPSHFPYTIDFIEDLERVSGVPQSYRLWASIIKMRQTQTNGRYGMEEGLDLRTAQPYRYYSNRRGDTASRRGVGLPLWRTLAEALLIDFVEDASRATQAQWDAASGLSAVQDSTSRDFSTCDRCWSSLSDPVPFPDHTQQGLNTFRLIPKLRELGVSEAVIGRLLDWCEDMWPLGPWASLRR